MYAEQNDTQIKFKIEL